MFSCIVYFQEFEAIYQQFFPNGSPKKFASYVFNIFDTNKVCFSQLFKSLTYVYSKCLAHSWIQYAKFILPCYYAPEGEAYSRCFVRLSGTLSGKWL